MEKLINSLQKNHTLVGMNILYTDKDHIIDQKYFGKMDIENDVDTKANTIYRIASISKVIVALGIMKLYDEGKVDIYEDVSKYLGFKLRNPHYPDDKITLEMIMTQTSSLCDGDEDPNVGYDAVNGPHIYVPLKELLTNPDYKYYSPKTFTKYKPGEKFLYSNLGCGVLACIIEHVSGEFYSDYIERVLLRPMGLDASYRPSQIKNKELIASLYDYRNGEFVLDRSKDLFLEKEFPVYPLGDNFRGPAGGLFISPIDLSKIMRLLMNDGTFEGFTYVKESTIKFMKEIHWQGDSGDPSYKKKGLQLNLIDGLTKDTLMGHFGCAYGLRSFMLFNNDFGYISLCNGGHYVETSDHMIDLHEQTIKGLIEVSYAGKKN